MQAHSAFTVARRAYVPEMLESGPFIPQTAGRTGYDFSNIMSVDVPRYEFRTKARSRARCPMGLHRRAANWTMR